MSKAHIIFYILVIILGLSTQLDDPKLRLFIAAGVVGLLILMIQSYRYTIQKIAEGKHDK